VRLSVDGGIEKSGGKKASLSHRLLVVRRVSSIDASRRLELFIINNLFDHFC
jgi:hypothetical protein